VDAKELQKLFDALDDLEGHKSGNSKKKVAEIMKKYDIDNSKSLNKAEFIEAILHENVFDRFQ
jgi:vacuolar-type H+-ATPase subunit C/Vma6